MSDGHVQFIKTTVNPVTWTAHKGHWKAREPKDWSLTLESQAV